MQHRATRFAIERPLEYRLRDPSGPTLGKGRTVNISRRGLLFQTDAELGVGCKIELIVEIGDAFGGSTNINLHVQGVTVRSQRGRVAVAIKKYRLKPIAEIAAQSAN